MFDSAYGRVEVRLIVDGGRWVVISELVAGSTSTRAPDPLAGAE